MMELPKHDNLFPREVAQFLRISLTTCYDMIQQGIIPASKIGNQYRIPRQKFLDWYENQKIQNDFLSA